MKYKEKRMKVRNEIKFKKIGVTSAYSKHHNLIYILEKIYIIYFAIKVLEKL